MSTVQIDTPSLRLISQNRDEVRAQLEQMSSEQRAQVSAAWLALLDGSAEPNPWTHGFGILLRPGLEKVGTCGFKGPPSADGLVEIAYGIDPRHQGRGYATEAAAALVAWAFSSPGVHKVLAHTLPERNASGQVLAKCGFIKIGEAVDPEDGLVWRWERLRPNSCNRSD